MDENLQKIKPHEKILFLIKNHICFFHNAFLFFSKLLSWSCPNFLAGLNSHTLPLDPVSLQGNLQNCLSAAGQRPLSEIVPPSPTEILRYSTTTALRRKTQLPAKIIPATYLLYYQLKDRTSKVQLLQDIINNKQIKDKCIVYPVEM